MAARVWGKLRLLMALPFVLSVCRCVMLGLRTTRHKMIWGEGLHPGLHCVQQLRGCRGPGRAEGGQLDNLPNLVASAPHAQLNRQLLVHHITW
jgi:hypothetical protein